MAIPEQVAADLGKASSAGLARDTKRVIEIGKS